MWPRYAARNSGVASSANRSTHADGRMMVPGTPRSAPSRSTPLPHANLLASSMTLALAVTAVRIRYQATHLSDRGFGCAAREIPVFACDRVALRGAADVSRSLNKCPRRPGTVLYLWCSMSEPALWCSPHRYRKMTKKKKSAPVICITLRPIAAQLGRRADQSHRTRPARGPAWPSAQLAHYFSLAPVRRCRLLYRVTSLLCCHHRK